MSCVQAAIWQMFLSMLGQAYCHTVAHAISLVGWLKHAKSFFFCRQAKCSLRAGSLIQKYIWAVQDLEVTTVSA